MLPGLNKRHEPDLKLFFMFLSEHTNTCSYKTSLNNFEETHPTSIKSFTFQDSDLGAFGPNKKVMVKRDCTVLLSEI